MQVTSVVLNHTLPTDAVDLGRLVVNIREPSQEFYQAKSLLRDTTDQRLERFSEIFQNAKGSKLHVLLMTIFSATFKTWRNSTAHIEAATCITQQLRNSDDYFRELCKVPTARAWLERALQKNKSAFLVVGIKTVIDATVAQTEGYLQQTDSRLKIPVTTAATGFPIPILDDTIDPKGGWSRTREVGASGQYFAPGEQVYAVQYRKVHLSLFSRRNVDKSWLENGNRWKKYVGSRGVQADAETGCVEASLGELQQGQLGNCESLEVEGEEIYLIEAT